MIRVEKKREKLQKVYESLSREAKSYCYGEYQLNGIHGVTQNYFRKITLESNNEARINEAFRCIKLASSKYRREVEILDRGIQKIKIPHVNIVIN